MAKLVQRKRGNKTPVKKKDIVDQIKNEPTGENHLFYRPTDKDFIISTGSTLIDLAIGGGRVFGGGVPGGILMEIFGESSTGKTALAMEICGSGQFHGGEIEVLDPESRIDQSYANTYGASIPFENYSRPNLVPEIIDTIMEWEPQNENVLNICAVDSIAAVCSEMEMEKEDKRGQARAKDFSAGLRKVARLLSRPHMLTIFTNQIRDGGLYGNKPPGGFAVGFYSTVRIKLSRGKPARILKKKKINGVEAQKVIGINTVATIVKNHFDDEYRTAPLYIVYGVGIDDVRANLQWCKDRTKSDKYDCINKEYKSIDSAISYIEENNLEMDLRERVINLWEEIENAFRIKRKKKVRF